MVDKIVLFILIFLFAALVLSVIGSYILLYMYKADDDYTKKKKQVDNKILCKKVEIEQKRRLWDEYFWHTPKKFFWISGIFILAIIIPTAFMNIYSIIFSVIIFLGYLYFLKWAYNRYQNFPIIAKKKLDTFEEPIREAVKKAAIFPGDTIRKYAVEDEVLSEDFNSIFIVEQPKEVTKLEFPPFAPPPKRTIINTRKLEFLVFTNEFVCSYTSAWKFNLLEPERKPEKAGCAEKDKGALGPSSREHFYSNIAYGKFDGDTFKVVYKDGQEFELITVFDKLPAELKKKKGAIMGALKHKLRITERQILRKVDEHAKIEYIKKLRELEREKATSQEEPETPDDKEDK